MLNQKRSQQLNPVQDAQGKTVFRLGRICRWCHRQTGQAMVETAMVLMILLFILMIIFDLGRVVVIYSSMTAAAQDAAHIGVLTSNTGMIQTAATDRMILADPADVTVVVDRTSTYANVTLTYTFQPITPIISSLIPSGIELTQSARMATIGSVVP